MHDSTRSDTISMRLDIVWPFFFWEMATKKIFNSQGSLVSERLWGEQMGKKDERNRQRDAYRREFKTGGKSTKTKKKSAGRKVK